MKPVARIGDIVHGICNGSGHTSNRAFVGTWVSGSGFVVADGLGVIRVGDQGITDCGHIFVAETGSGLSTADGLAIHRVDDTVIVLEGGTGVTVTGSGTTSSD